MFSRLLELVQTSIVVGTIGMLFWHYAVLPSLSAPSCPPPPVVDWSGAEQVWHAFAR